MPSRANRHRKGAADHVAVGRVLASRSLSGEVKVEPLTDLRERFERKQSLWVKGSRHSIEEAHWRKGHVYIKLSGIDSVEAAEGLRGQLLSLPKGQLETLPEGQYYRFQIVGMKVYDREGQHLGRIVEVLATGSNDVYVVQGQRGEILLPAIDDVVREVDVAGGRMVVELMEGMLPG
jgi:16S rRNA processing protein RimM